MTTDLRDEVRRTFVRHADEVEVPPIDQLAFQQQVRGARRGGWVRRSAWVAAGVAGVAAAALTVSALAPVEESLVPAAGPAAYSQAPSGTPPIYEAFDGSVSIIHLSNDGWTSERQNVNLGRSEDVFRTVDGVVAVTDDSSLVRVVARGDGSAQDPFTVGSPRRLASDVESVAVADDGRTGAWFTRDGGESEFVLYDFVQDKPIDTRPAELDGASGAIVAVQGAEAIVSVDGRLETWNSDTSSSREFDLSSYFIEVSANAGMVALTRADVTATDVFADNGSRLQKVATFPVVSGELSPEGDNVVGFTPYAIDGAQADIENTDFIELWSVHGDGPSSFTGLPQTVYEYSWLDNDTIALTGGSRGADWPGELNTYTCELASLRCTQVATDDTGDQDRLPMLASGRGL